MHTALLIFVIPANASLIFVIPVNISYFRHPDVRRDPDFPHVYWLKVWVPAFAGMTVVWGIRRQDRRDLAMPPAAEPFAYGQV